MALDNVRNNLINQFYDNSQTLDTMLLVEKFLADTAEIFCYPNWFNGELLAGPSVGRYWVTIVLKYDHNEMPDPDGGMVLAKLGCKVFYKRFKHKVKVDVKSSDDLDKRHRPKTKEEPIWLVKLIIPKKFLEDKKLKNLDMLDDELDVDQIANSLNAGFENGPTGQEHPDLGGQQPEQMPPI